MPEITSKLLLLLNERDLESLLRQIKRCGHARQAAPNDKSIVVDLQAAFVQGLQQPCLCHSHSYQVFCFVCSRLGLIHMHPGALVADIGHFKEVLVQSCFPAGVSEERLVSPRTARCHYDTVQVLLIYQPGNLLLSVSRTGIKVVLCINNVG